MKKRSKKMIETWEGKGNLTFNGENFRNYHKHKQTHV